MSKTIEFIPSSREVELHVPPPKPAKFYIPEWYRNTEVIKNPYELFNSQTGPNQNVKSCMPFLDALATGYIQETWSDIYITVENGIMNYHSSMPIQQVHYRAGNATPISEEYHSIEMTWKVPWMPKVPKGYSVLMCDPLNDPTRPIRSLAGVVDSDSFYHTPMGNMPFLIKSWFQGIIPAGTPMYVIIPIKRESWRHKALEYNQDVETRAFQMKRNFVNTYKNKFWNKKDYS